MNTGLGSRDPGLVMKTFVVVFFLLALHFCIQLSAFANDKWPGVDESVVEKYAAENGRPSREPLVNTDQGDLLLFVFLLAGAVGGFAAGYYWRMLVGEKPPRAGSRQ